MKQYHDFHMPVRLKERGVSRHIASCRQVLYIIQEFVFVMLFVELPVSCLMSTLILTRLLGWACVFALLQCA